MEQPSLGTRDEDRPSNERLFVLLGAITVVGGLSWVVLTPLEVVTSGATEYFVAYLTEPFVGLLGIAGSYGLARRQENAVGHRGRLGHLLLITGFLLVGFPAALDSIVWMPAMIFFLGQTDFILISTLAGVVLVYTGVPLWVLTPIPGGPRPAWSRGRSCSHPCLP